MKEYEEREELRIHYQGILSDLGLGDVFAYLLYHENSHDIIASHTGDLTFEILDKISKIFHTRLIDISCDQGTSSDHFHEKMIHIRNGHLDP